MRKTGLGQLGLVGLLIAVLAGAASGADWTYADNFPSDDAKEDSCIHSLFWLDRATPPPGPYLFYLHTGGSRQLVFMGYQNQLAELGYCFPVNSGRTQRTVKGWLIVEVSFPNDVTISQSPPGQLLVSTSGDGVAWSAPQSLGAGQQQLPVESASGTAYVRFSGTRVAIDNLDVSLSSEPATISVPGTFSTIQAAIDGARHGDIIEVGPNTYAGPGNRNIQFYGKAITLRSTSGPQNTIIDAGGADRGFHFHGAEGADTVLSGFTIRNGQATGAPGGGIYCEFSSPTITNCIIQNCRADVGGGIGGWNAAPVIIDCTISSNTASQGGGIGLAGQSDATITRCLIAGNSAAYGGGFFGLDSRALVGGCEISGNAVNANGGGAFCAGTLGDITFKNCVIFSNSATLGAGLYAESALGFQRGAVTVIHCTIANNQVPYFQPGGGVYSTGAGIFVTNSIVWGNGTNPLVADNAVLMYPVTYSDVEGGGHAGEGNLNANPLFANAWSGDYHLQSHYGRYDPQGGWVTDGSDSPCIDAGDPSVSAADEPSPNGGRVNMGAYGATREASKSAEHTVWHVAKTGSNWNTGRSQERAFLTISHALGRAQTGDTILVWPGVYREEIVFESKAVTLQSAADAAVLEAPNAYAVSFYYAESSKSILANFVIRGCPVGAIFCYGASPTLRNLTIVNNGFGIEAYEGAEPYIVNCIVWGNSDGSLSQCKAYFSDVQGNADPRAGNINVDPLFADPANGDFHLKSVYGRYLPALDTWVTDSVVSPCVDRGNPEDYYEAELEPNGDVINMGAYGGTPYASKSRF